jgi:integrase
VLGFTWDRVDLPGRVLHLDKEKSGPGRRHPITEDRLFAVFERRRRARTLAGPWVFWRTQRGGRLGARVTETWYRDQWRAACATTGLAGKIPHDFRRTLYYNASLADVELATSRNLAGHPSLTTAKRDQIFVLTRPARGLERMETHRQTRCARAVDADPRGAGHLGAPQREALSRCWRR